jgi:hypothetical protein
MDDGTEDLDGTVVIPADSATKLENALTTLETFTDGPEEAASFAVVKLMRDFGIDLERV